MMILLEHLHPEWLGRWNILGILMSLYLKPLIATGNLLGLESDSNIPEIQNKEHSVNLQPDILATSDYLESAKNRDDVILT